MTDRESAQHVSPGDETQLVATNVLVMAAVFACYFFTSYRMGEDARTVGVVALLTILVSRGTWSVSAWPWAAVLGSLLVSLWRRPIDVPNHHYMMSYVAAALVLCLSAPAPQWGDLMRRNARWMLIVLMGFATLQKTVSPTFLDGSYLGYEIARGGFGDPVLPLFGSVADVTAANDNQVVAFRALPPEDAAYVQLQPATPYPTLVARGFMVSILAIEVLLFAGFLWLPHSLLPHGLLLSFIVTLGVLRQEFTFISVVSAMGLMACSGGQLRLRTAYATLAVLCAAAVL
ncbi:MAG: hypothetical protein AAGG46_10755, partial [Planctomycetota bacterium]